MSNTKNNLPDYDEVKACIQEFLDEIMNFEDASVGIYKPGFMTPELVKELEDEGMDIKDYDQDFVTFWIDGHEITIEAKYHPVGPNEHESKWEIAD